MILSLDASTTRGSVALVNGQNVVQEVFIDTPRGRGGALFSALEKVLGETADIKRVIVGTGPGSYNGIRSAIAVAWGISAARQIPLAGISSLLGLDEGSYYAVGDARRGQYYFARVSGGKFVTHPSLLQTSQLLDSVQQADSLPIFAPAPIEFLQRVIVRTPSAARLARLAADWEPNCPQPLYLKAAHITTPKSRQLGVY
ncbi:MAG TPA: tRNA (adenosine(37)-N6)-threonylcarbamoyltransferase complex dimerization subunit type 1 TsaB [Terrimicrobiaceae bacterium]